MAASVNHSGQRGANDSGNAAGSRGRAGLPGLLARRFGCMVCAQWGSGLLSGVFLVLLARSGPELFGLFSLALALGVLVTMITGAGFENYLVPRFTEGRVHMRRILVQTLYIQAGLLLLSLFLLVALCGILGYDAGKTRLILVIAAGLGPTAMAQSFFVLCRVQGRQDTEMRIRIPAGLLGSGFGIACLLLGAPPILTACFKLVEALVLFLLIGLALRWRFGDFPTRLLGWIGRWRDGFFFAGIAVCGLLYNKLNIYILDIYGGSYALGLYNAPWEITDGLSILISGALVEKVLFPLMAGQWNSDRQAFMHLTGITVKCLLLLGIFAYYVFFVEGDRLLILLYGQDYLASEQLFHAQLPCILAAFLHNLAACMLISMRLYRPVFLVYLSGLVCNVFLCFWLIPTHGALGAAWAISCTKVWMMALTVGLAVRNGLELRASHLGAAVLAAALAWGGHAFFLPQLPREAAEIIGFVPLLVLAACWLPGIIRGGTR